jgi:hypothetical protein
MTTTTATLDEATRERVGRMLDALAEEKRPCRACGRTTWFVRTKAGRLAPYTDDALSHFADCPHADRFRKAKP